MKDEQSVYRAARIQAAVVRTVAGEMEREGLGPNENDELRAQALEESARLVGLSVARTASPIRSTDPGRTTAALAGDGSRGRVLVVEDDDATRTAIARGLAPAYEIVTARDGAEGIELASGQTFDAIVTDIGMPEVDGITMIDRIRARASSPMIPVVFLTGETAPEQVIAGLAGGAVAYLVKPVDLELLDQELQWALDAARGAHAVADGAPRRTR
jgi:CheY-like chemotaxis protein